MFYLTSFIYLTDDEINSLVVLVIFNFTHHHAM